MTRNPDVRAGHGHRPRPGPGQSQLPHDIRGSASACLAPVRKKSHGLEGRIRGHMYTGGARRDSLLYSLLAGERAPG